MEEVRLTTVMTVCCSVMHLVWTLIAFCNTLTIYWECLYIHTIWHCLHHCLCVWYQAAHTDFTQASGNNQCRHLLRSAIHLPLTESVCTYTQYDTVYIIAFVCGIRQHTLTSHKPVETVSLASHENRSLWNLLLLTTASPSWRVTWKKAQRSAYCVNSHRTLVVLSPLEGCRPGIKVGSLGYPVLEEQAEHADSFSVAHTNEQWWYVSDKYWFSFYIYDIITSNMITGTLSVQLVRPMRPHELMSSDDTLVTNIGSVFIFMTL